jgi:hypothetical protein
VGLTVAILDLQRREMEAGRIRFGNKAVSKKTGKLIPNRLDHPLITSPDKGLIDLIAAKHKVDSTPWPGGEGQWQVEIDADLNVLVPVSPEPCSQWWERWSGGGCMRRCDGFKDIINDAPCDCDKDADKRECKATSRFVVLLPETGDARWRVETKSIFAAIELPAALERAQGERTGEVIPGVLSVEQRPGKEGKVPVPVIRLSRSAESGVSAEQAGVGHAPAVRVESPEPVGSGSGDSPELDDIEHPGAADFRRAEVEAGRAELIDAKQIARMMAVSREHNVTEAELKTIVRDIAGVASRKLIPADRFEAVLETIRKWQELQGQLMPPERRGDV